MFKNQKLNENKKKVNKDNAQDRELILNYDL